MLPAPRPSGLPILWPGGLGRITGPLPCYGLVPQGGSACLRRAATLDLLTIWNVPRVAAPLAGTARHGHGLGDSLPHDRTTRTPYISIPLRMNCPTWHDAECKPGQPKAVGDLGPMMRANARTCAMHAWLSADFFVSPFRELPGLCAMPGASKTRGL